MHESRHCFRRTDRWLGHVKRMDDSCLPKLLLFGQLSTGTRSGGRPRLRFIDCCKRDMKECGINTKSWEMTALDRSAWRSLTNKGSVQVQNQHIAKRREKKRRLTTKTTSSTPPQNTFVCDRCSRVCRSRIGLFSHRRACISIQQTTSGSATDDVTPATTNGL